MRLPLVDFKDVTLFGNSAAEDEPEDIFSGYVIDRPELTQFLDGARSICIARAYRGEGKSALLRRTRIRLEKRDTKPLLVEVKGNEIAPDSESPDTDVWRRLWKKALLNAVAAEVGRTISMAWTDDAISLVEEAERSGFKSKSLVSAVFDRLNPGSSLLKFERDRPELANAAKVIKRWIDDSDSIWIIVDDIDENFQSRPAHKAKVAGYLSAIRDIVNTIPQVRIRSAIRPTTWTTLANEYESLSKVAQYVIDLKWEMTDLRQILVSRIRAYLLRSRRHDDAENVLGERLSGSNYLNVVFDNPVVWGKETKEVWVPLSTLARRRPRWLIELCQEAAKKAAATRAPTVTLQAVVECLDEFGNARMADVSAEYSVQCPQTRELLQAFSRGQEEYSTDELLDVIKRKIMNLTAPSIAGVAVVGPVEVAAYLFQIGFITGRRTLEDGGYEHVSYFEKPTLFVARTNRDDGLRWEIHPVYRQALKIRDAQGRLMNSTYDRKGR